MLEVSVDPGLAARSPLMAPRELSARLPASPAAQATVSEARHAIRAVIHGRDRHRLVVIVGPCSIHDTEAAFDYAQRLRRVAVATRDQLVVVMRAYFEKPRTTLGWKGLINDPRLDGSCDIGSGLEQARRLLVAVAELGVPCGSELLDPFTPPFIADLLAWAAIGARTIESPIHRQLASSLSMPVGFKNATDGNVAAAGHALEAASHSHTFLGLAPDGRSELVRTRGNADGHLVLRGGESAPNYDRASVADAGAIGSRLGLPRPVMVDCSHANSRKDHRRQGAVCRSVLEQVREGRESVMGLLLESNLRPGRQCWEPGVPLRRGVSITDACIGWSETEALLIEIAEAVDGAQRRTP